MSSRARIGWTALTFLIAALWTGAPALADPEPTNGWLTLPYVQWGYLTPQHPEPGDDITLTLFGYFPYDCGAITDTSSTPTQVAFTMRPGTPPACSDSARSWTATFPIGNLPAGWDSLVLLRTLINADQSVSVRQATLYFEVGHHDPPPPPCSLFGYFTTNPNPARDDAPTIVTLHGCFPYSCGEIAGVRILGPTDIEVTQREAVGCPDSVTDWAVSVNLGLMAAGTHNLIVRVGDVAKPGVQQVFGTWIHVNGDTVPPPPPPPSPPLGPLFTGAETAPSAPTSTDSTVLLAHGIFPYLCGRILDVQVVDDSHIDMTFRRDSSCGGDTARIWHRAIGLGYLADGHHEVEIRIRDLGSADSLTTHTFLTTFEVGGSEAPPASAPPSGSSDSLLLSRPNPFLDQTSFGVVLAQSSGIEIGIFDLQGRAVRRMFRGSLPAGTSKFVWDGRRDDGQRAPAGVYFYRAARPGGILTRRVVLLPRP